MLKNKLRWFSSFENIIKMALVFSAILLVLECSSVTFSVETNDDAGDYSEVSDMSTADDSSGDAEGGNDTLTEENTVEDESTYDSEQGITEDNEEEQLTSTENSADNNTEIGLEGAEEGTKEGAEESTEEAAQEASEETLEEGIEGNDELTEGAEEEESSMEEEATEEMAEEEVSEETVAMAPQETVEETTEEATEEGSGVENGMLMPEEELAEAEEIALEEIEDEEMILAMAVTEDDYDYIINLSEDTNGSYNGYSVVGAPNKHIPTMMPVTVPSGTLTFNTNADENTYYITQNYLNNPRFAGCPKSGSSIINEIKVPNGISVTLILSDIDFAGEKGGSIVIDNGGELTLLLDGTNYVRSHINVPPGAVLTIDSFNRGSTNGSLIMPQYEPNHYTSSAKIGGAGVSATGTKGENAGTINIKGGSIEIETRSTGAGIGGGGCTINGSGDGGNGGSITITGGEIYIEQRGVIITGKPVRSGAGIGGGGGNTVDGGHAGDLLIDGGKVIVDQYTQAAGIGGGSMGTVGNITINNGYVKSTVYGIAHTTTNGLGDGVPIGASSGTNAPGPANITINGGTVWADATDYGGAGIGIYNGGQPCNIIITGGNIYARSILGTGIGFFADSNNGSISITGGTVVAESKQSAAIGGKIDYEPTFTLNAAAKVTAYSGSATPAINVQDNLGDGYYVNAKLETAFATNKDLKVYKESSGALFKELALPAGYPNFAYSSELSSSRVDNVFAPDGASIKSIERRKDNSIQIYSVKMRNEYNAHQIPENTYAGKPIVGVLPVKLSTTSYCTVTEKHVDKFGQPLEDIEDVLVMIAKGAKYIKDNIPPLDDYVAKGHKWDYAPGGSGIDFTPGAPSSDTTTGTTINDDKTIYYVYSKETTVTISKVVEGEYGNRLKDFNFTVYFTDQYDNPLTAGTKFDYIGATLAGYDVMAPENETLTLENGGLASFTLRHGQSITIEGIPTNVKVGVREDSTGYMVSIRDSKTSGSIGDNDTGLQNMSSEPRTFDFINSREGVVVSAVGTGGIESALILQGILILMLLSTRFVKSVQRRRKEAVIA
ncbi:MAG: hypothetical protein FWG43_01400 [Clostridiales bacterium]|nr:hypothetical protein [Clostridiales bacterium]